MEHTKEFEKRVKALKHVSGINPFAVATAQLEREHKKIFKKG